MHTRAIHIHKSEFRKRKHLAYPPHPSKKSLIPLIRERPHFRKCACTARKQFARSVIPRALVSGWARARAVIIGDPMINALVNFVKAGPFSTFFPRGRGRGQFVIASATPTRARATHTLSLPTIRNFYPLTNLSSHVKPSRSSLFSVYYLSDRSSIPFSLSRRTIPNNLDFYLLKP